ncbi:vWA domain-containing protein [Lacinutrix salivirga]
MQFKHPELLYALFLLLIPIIVHLFQLRKFKKEQFTNVAFLKKVTMQTRKSSQIKKWLTLLTRLLLLAAIIFAFAQPFTAKNDTFNKPNETVIYLDNSFSMQAKGEQGELFKRAVQDLISNVPENEQISLFTNEEVYKNTTIKAIKNELLQLNYSATQLPYNASLLKAEKLFSKNNTSNKNVVFISDFQQKNEGLNAKNTGNINYNFVQLTPVTTANISIDSVFVSKRMASNLELSVVLKKQGKTNETVSVALYNNNVLLAKSAVDITETATTTFTLPANQIIKGRVTITDNQLQYDNNFYFNINAIEKIKVLSITEADDSFLKRIYTEDEFEFTSTKSETINYALIDSQNTIILNELNSIPTALQTALQAFTNKGGSLIIIPSAKIDITNYNQLLTQFGFSKFLELNTSKKRLTTINYSHPLFADGVFEKQVKNFQYPKVESYYSQSQNGASAVLQFEDNKPFLSQRNSVYVFSTALNTKNSNFKNINLIVPTFYNMARFSLKQTDLYYNIGKENSFDVAVDLQQDAVLTLNNGTESIIPLQQYYNNKVVITTNETPSKSGIYEVANKTKNIKQVSYNYNRSESQLAYQNLENLDFGTVSNTIETVFNTIKSNSKINALWKWFAIFAVILLIVEMLILKYFK